MKTMRSELKTNLNHMSQATRIQKESRHGMLWYDKQILDTMTQPLREAYEEKKRMDMDYNY